MSAFYVIYIWVTYLTTRTRKQPWQRTGIQLVGITWTFRQNVPEHPPCCPIGSLRPYSSCRPTLPSLPHISFFSRRRLHLNPSASLAIPHRTQSSRRFPGSRQVRARQASPRSRSTFSLWFCRGYFGLRFMCFASSCCTAVRDPAMSTNKGAGGAGGGGTLFSVFF